MEVRMRFPLRLAIVALLFATPAFASYGGKPDLPTPPSAPAGETPNNDQGTVRQQAEPWYRDAYGDVMKGSQELERGNAKNAEKKFRRALEHSKEAVSIDSTYAEAWNLVGFTSRKLGDYPASFEAYRIALRQKPDFALAHEYYGEGLLETGNLAGAMEQLAALKRIGDPAMITELQAAVDKFVAAHPVAAHPANTPADSTAAQSASQPGGH
jgi:tetratricopeptide (TPR) repeat protein